MVNFFKGTLVSIFFSPRMVFKNNKYIESSSTKTGSILNLTRAFAKIITCDKFSRNFSNGYWKRKRNHKYLKKNKDDNLK